MGIRGDIDETDRDLNRDMYPNRTKSNPFNLDEEVLSGDTEGSLSDFFVRTGEEWKDGFGGSWDDEVESDFRGKDILGEGKYYEVKGLSSGADHSEWIQKQIEDEIQHDHEFDFSLVEVLVIGDEVHLEGKVQTRDLKSKVEEICLNVPGTRVIINKLLIGT